LDFCFIFRAIAEPNIFGICRTILTAKGVRTTFSIPELVESCAIPQTKVGTYFCARFRFPENRSYARRFFIT